VCTLAYMDGWMDEWISHVPKSQNKKSANLSIQKHRQAQTYRHRHTVTHTGDTALETFKLQETFVCARSRSLIHCLLMHVCICLLSPLLTHFTATHRSTKLWRHSESTWSSPENTTDGPHASRTVTQSCTQASSARDGAPRLAVAVPQTIKSNHRKLPNGER
jgi:hypothetical protein